MNQQIRRFLCWSILSVQQNIFHRRSYRDATKTTAGIRRRCSVTKLVETTFKMSLALSIHTPSYFCIQNNIVSVSSLNKCQRSLLAYHILVRKQCWTRRMQCSSTNGIPRYFWGNKSEITLEYHTLFHRKWSHFCANWKNSECVVRNHIRISKPCKHFPQYFMSNVSMSVRNNAQLPWALHQEIDTEMPLFYRWFSI